MVTRRRLGAAFAALAAPVLFAGAPSGADRVVLKSGRELVGRLLDEADHRVRFVDDARGEVDLPRRLVRTVVRADAHDHLFLPLWLDPPHGEPPAGYVRFRAPRDGEPGALETGISRWFHVGSRTTLFLVGAVHIADRPYYERLQDLLDSCDVVLFEGVGGGGQGGEAAPTRRQIERMDVLFQVQRKLNDALGLTFQKDGLDYDRPWWKNADVSLGALTAELDRRGVALPTDHPLVRMVLELALRGLDAGQAAGDPRLRNLIKRQAASVLGMADTLMKQQMRGLGDVLVDWRNDAALAVLRQELDAGEPGRWLALFYGAAHLPDLAAKLAAGGFEFQASGWLPAWRID